MDPNATPQGVPPIPAVPVILPQAPQVPPMQVVPVDDLGTAATLIQEKDERIQTLATERDTAISEAGELQKQLDAAKELIDALRGKMEEAQEAGAKATTDTEEHTALERKFDASTKLLREALTRLEGLKDVSEKLAAATKIIDTMLEERKQTKVDRAVDELVGSHPDKEKLAALFKHAETPQDVKELAESINEVVANAGRTVPIREALPGKGAEPLNEAATHPGKTGPSKPKNVGQILAQGAERIVQQGGRI